MKINIGYPINYYLRWMGGAALAAAFTNASLAATKVCGQEASQFLMYDISGTDIEVPDCGFIVINKHQLKINSIFNEFVKLTLFEEIYMYRRLDYAVRGMDLNILGPSHHDLGHSFPIPWSAYLPDFQHRHMPKYFSNSEIENRNKIFAGIVKNANLVFVNSSSVALDIARFYSKAEVGGEIKKFPELKYKIENNLDYNLIRSKYEIYKNYFIVCSQQWMHKRHEIIITAFSEFLKSTGVDCMLIITGERSDYRNKDYTNQVSRMISELNLDDRVKYLGLIPKEEQLCLIANSVALIQASEIEGGPGASGVMEASCLGVPVIVSDIEVNRELNYQRQSFFQTNNPSSLSYILSEVFCSTSNNILAFQSNEVDVINLCGGVQLNKILIDYAHLKRGQNA